MSVSLNQLMFTLNSSLQPADQELHLLIVAASAAFWLNKPLHAANVEPSHCQEHLETQEYKISYKFRE
jgi:hypothetical protein